MKIQFLFLIYFLICVTFGKSSFPTGKSRLPVSSPKIFQNENLLNIPNLNCTKCENGFSCCDNEMCCSGGQYCCERNATCCAGSSKNKIGGICCLDIETCCPDSVHGGTCCIKETTFCCPLSSRHASRCCPRWTVCCEEGLVGCCDPGLGISAEKVGYALYVIPNWEDNTPFYSLSINLENGEKVETKTNYNDFGESTRLFTFNPSKNKFYLLQTNFTTPPFEIYLWTVDSVSSIVTRSKILGNGIPRNVTVTGYKFNDGDGLIYFATYSTFDKNGYKFFSLNLKTSTATLLASTTFSSKELDNYEGWFQDLLVETGKITFFRLGDQNPVTSINPGLGITTLHNGKLSTEFHSNLPLPNSTTFPLSFNLSPLSKKQKKISSFYSIAPGNRLLEANLHLIEWNLEKSKILTYWENSHTVPIYGNLAETITPEKYFALVVHNNLFDSNFDRWAIVSFDFKTGKNTYEDLSPFMLAKTDSISGFGVPF